MARPGERDAGSRGEVVGQIARFAITGVGNTLVYSAIYLALTTWVLPREWATLAVLPAFLVAVAFGFQVSARWAFRTQSQVAGGAQGHRYLLAQTGGLALNFAFTWLATVVFGLAPWMALVPCVTITPVLTFVLMRFWVFA